MVAKSRKYYRGGVLFWEFPTGRGRRRYVARFRPAARATAAPRLISESGDWPAAFAYAKAAGNESDIEDLLYIADLADR